MTHLSLCSGIGGLDLAVAVPTAVAEIDEAASEVLAERFPSAPNLGDWTQLADFDGVDIITGGLPCQPVSSAGRGRGDSDERYLFDDLLRILEATHTPPTTLVLENVRGLLHKRHQAAFLRLLEGLAGLGYVGSYGCVRASDAGAPHRRERWFCVAHHGDADLLGRDGRPGYLAETDGRGEPPHTGDEVARHPDGEGLQGRPAESERADQLPARAGGVEVAAHPHGSGGLEAVDGPQAASHGEPGHHAHGRGVDHERKGVHRPVLDDAYFGEWAPAVRRWESILGRPAPAPTEDGRLAAPFVEWMMGFPDGWVTDLAPRRPALRMLGNAVVPQQARLALDLVTNNRKGS